MLIIIIMKWWKHTIKLLKHHKHYISIGTVANQNLIFLWYQLQIWNTACLDLWLWFSCSFRVKHVLENVYLIKKK